MKKPQLLLASLAISAIGITAFWVNAKMALNPEHEVYIAAKMKEENKERMTFKGAMEYYKSVRANEITGSVSFEDIENAKNQARQLASKKMTRAFEKIEWQEMGPNNVGGRTRALVVDKDNPNKLYIGGVGGGLFISMDNGDSWVRRNGNDSTASPACVTIAQAANGDIYYGTGEGNAGFADNQSNSHNQQIIQMGEGIYKSTDGGNSFARLNTTKPSNSNTAADGWAYVDKIVTHPTDPNFIVAATNGGLRISKDGGATWNFPTGLTAGSTKVRFCDVEISADGNKIVAATIRRIYISTDGGTTFAPAGTAGYATTTSERIDVAIAPSNPNVIYACLAGIPTSQGTGLTGIYKSTDNCVSWSVLLQGGAAQTNPLGDQGTYNIAFGVHPLDENIVFCGGQINLWRYSNIIQPNYGWDIISSSNISPASGFAIHADQHGIVFNPANPNIMYNINDGGFYRTMNCLAAQPTFVEKNKNYSTAQCYGIAVSTIGRIVYGTQDNGSGIIGNSANSTLEANDLTGGDGMRCVISDLNPKHMITSVYYGTLYRSTDGGSSFSGFYDKNIDNSPASDPDNIPDDNGTNGNGMWITPMDFKEKKVGELTQQYFIIGTSSAVWMTQTPFVGKSIWFKLSKTGARYSAFASSQDGKVVYAGTQTGLVYRIDVPSLYDTTYKYFDTLNNTGGTHRQTAAITQTQIGNFGRFITDLSCSNDGESVVVTLGNYGNTSYVHRSSNARTGSPVSFSDITGNLPDAPAYTSIMVKGNPNKIMVGTEMGVFGTDNGGSTWVDLNFNTPTNEATWHPRCAVYELVEKSAYTNKDGSEYRGSIIFSGTHGRGVFRTTSMANFWPTGTNEITSKTNEIKLYPNPTADIAYFNYDAKSNEALSVSVFTVTGTKVRSFNFKASAGSNKFEMNVSDLAKGSYIVVINQGKERFTSTLLKN
jgi:photosystem II stability/assembly factor-like uncharacterized protein